jgi:putative two-component system hydrogenase maturation factor HypX/HoxX
MTTQEAPGRFAQRDRVRAGLRILFLTSAHNSMSQRAYVELTRLGHEVSIGLATSERAMFEAVERHSPELIVAPMLKRAIPEDIWREHVCILVHPGPRGDRGPSSLDWAILEDRKIDWSGPTKDVLRKLHSADTYPGVLD